MADVVGTPVEAGLLPPEDLPPVGAPVAGVLVTATLLLEVGPLPAGVLAGGLLAGGPLAGVALRAFKEATWAADGGTPALADKLSAGAFSLDSSRFY